MNCLFCHKQGLQEKGPEDDHYIQYLCNCADVTLLVAKHSQELHHASFLYIYKKQRFRFLYDYLHNTSMVWCDGQDVAKFDFIPSLHPKDITDHKIETILTFG